MMSFADDDDRGGQDAARRGSCCPGSSPSVKAAEDEAGEGDRRGLPGGGIPAGFGSVDFVLVWSKGSGSGHEDKFRDEKRRTFEENLEKEGLVLDREPTEPSGLNFIKIHAPRDVLKRYAEILKLRLPMRKVGRFGSCSLHGRHVTLWDLDHNNSSKVDRALRCRSRT